MSLISYVSAVGIFMHTMVYICHDISQAVNIICRHIENTDKVHWQVAKWIFGYLRGTADVGLVFNQGGEVYHMAIGYDNFDNRRSLIGFVITLSSSAISWKAKLQPTIALSTTETEYMTITEAIKEDI